MDLKLEQYNVRDATMRSLLALAHEFGIKTPTKDQQEALAEISDALEARVQDALDDAVKNFKMPEQEEEELVPADESETHLFYQDNMVYQVVHHGVVFGKFCNEPVEYDHETGKPTLCIKQWGHINPEHEDQEGNLRL